MPLHHIHKFCASQLGIPEDVVNYVDDLVDSGRCYVHDIGLEDSVIVVDEGDGQRIYIVLGIHGVLHCLYREGRVDDEYLKAFALHILLDCIDRKLRMYRRVPEDVIAKAVDTCREFVVNRVKISLDTPGTYNTPALYLPLPRETLHELTLKLLNVVQNITATAIDKLKTCIAYR